MLGGISTHFTRMLVKILEEAVTPPVRLEVEAGQCGGRYHTVQQLAGHVDRAQQAGYSCSTNSLSWSGREGERSSLSARVCLPNVHEQLFITTHNTM